MLNGAACLLLSDYLGTLGVIFSGGDFISLILLEQISEARFFRAGGWCWRGFRSGFLRDHFFSLFFGCSSGCSGLFFGGGCGFFRGFRFCHWFCLGFSILL